jgi:uncharacterized phage protein (TIGR02220 family)
MAKYRPLWCDFWDDPDIEKLSLNSKIVYIFLFSNRKCTESGIYGISKRHISERTGIDIKKIDICFDELSTKITYDNKAEIVFVHAFMRRNFKGRPDLLESSILNDAENHKSKMCWKLFTQVYKNHNILNHLVMSLQSLYKDFNDNDNELSVKKEEDTKKENATTKDKNIEPEIVEIVEYMNKIFGSQFKTEGQTTELIRARLKDQPKIAAFKAVIDLKFKNWFNDPAMKPFLRPKTLFSVQHFPEYVEEARMSLNKSTTLPYPKAIT